MFITGTIIDITAIIVAGIIGLLIRNKLPKRLFEPLITIIAGIAFVDGIGMALKTHNLLIGFVSLVLGVIVGELLALDRRVSSFVKVDNIFDLKPDKNATTFKAFVTASLISVIGPLTILGSIQNGVSGNVDLLVFKTGLDAIVTLLLTSALGYGVILSAATVLVVQGIISLVASMLGNFLTVEMINEISATGGIILIFLALNVMDIKKTAILNMIPALFFVVFIYRIFVMFHLV